MHFLMEIVHRLGLYDRYFSVIFFLFAVFFSSVAIKKVKNANISSIFFFWCHESINSLEMTKNELIFNFRSCGDCSQSNCISRTWIQRSASRRSREKKGQTKVTFHPQHFFITPFFQYNLISSCTNNFILTAGEWLCYVSSLTYWSYAC